MRTIIKLIVLPLIFLFVLNIMQVNPGYVFVGSAIALDNEPTPTEKVVLPQGTKIFIGEPANYPLDIIGALIEFFKAKEGISEAYLAHVFVPDSGEPPHNVVGIRGQGNVAEVVREAGDIISRFSPEGGFVDFVDVSKKGQISDYMINETKPFYSKADLLITPTP